MQALLDNLIERGVDPEGCYLFIVDGAKALSKALRRTFGADIPIQRCQVHKARNITDRLAPKHHAAVRRALKQAWEMDDAEKAERLIRNLARRFEQEAPDVSRSILEGLDEILTVVRLGLPLELRRSLASTNIIESMNSVIRQGLPEREAVAECQDGLALDSRRHVRSQEGLPASQGLQGSCQFSSRLFLTIVKTASLTKSRTPHNLPSSSAAQASFNSERDIPRPAQGADCLSNG